MRNAIPVPVLTSEMVRKIGLPLCVAGMLGVAGYIAGLSSAPVPEAKTAERLAAEPAPRLIELARGDRAISAADVTIHDLLNPPAEPPAPVREAPPFVRAATLATVAPTPKPAPNRVAGERKVAIPAGVERFDSCTGACESRDPRRLGAAPAPAAAPAAPALDAAAAREAESGYRMPDLVGESKALLDRTVSATGETVDMVKRGMQSVIDVVW